MKIPTIDLVILLSYLAAMVVFGLIMGRRQKSAADFMVSGRDMPWWLVLFSIVATETSTVTFLSIPGVAFGGDLTWLQLPLGFIVGRLVVVAVLMPRYFRHDVFTVYELLEQRFGGAAVKRVASVLFIVTRTAADGLRLFLSALVLQELAGIQLEVAVIVLGTATIIYTFLGGMRAVVWTDFVQFLVYTTGAAIALWILLDRIDGGTTELLRAAGEAGKLQMFDFDWAIDRATVFWAGLIGGAVLAVGSHGVDQLMVQRYLCAKSRGHASAALALSGVVVWLQFALFMVIGTACWLYYQQTGTLAEGTRQDRVFATFLLTDGVMPRGLLGIVLGAVFAAAMSTLSSSLNSSSTALWNDLWQPLLRKPPSERTKLVTLRSFTILFGVLQIGVGIGGQYVGDSVVNSVLSVASLTTGLILGLFLLGMFSRRAQSVDAVIGLIGGMVMMGCVGFATPIAWPWWALIGASTVVSIGLATSRVPLVAK